jgi:L-amino acid N-acyltransferase YncA
MLVKERRLSSSEAAGPAGVGAGSNGGTRGCQRDYTTFRIRIENSGNARHSAVSCITAPGRFAAPHHSARTRSLHAEPTWTGLSTGRLRLMHARVTLDVMNIRDSLETDIPAITAIYGHAVRLGTASFEVEPPDAGEMARRRAEIAGKGYPYLVATDAAGALLGYAYASTYRTRPAYRFTVENSVYVAPASQGRGIGSTLLDALILRCEAAGYRLMIAVIGDSANAASIALHRKVGFAYVGVLPGVGWKHERWLNTVLMTRTLGAGIEAPP